MDDQRVINTLKGLVIDAVNQAQSGHPGGAMSSMDFAYVLFTEFLNFDPDDPDWRGRDRFILSAGHESMLLYSLFHMIGWLPMNELKNFRQLHSKTPGHPENYQTPGVECTTGPLGQGAAMSVGFALGAKHLQSTLDEELFGYKTYALLGDGCMQEDITLGAASIAGHFGLGNLVWYYDKNRIQISGAIERSTSDNEEQIFRGFGWNVHQLDGHNREQIRSCLSGLDARKPTLIIGESTIAKGAYSMEGTHKTHGAPLPAEERNQTKKKLGLDENESFACPDNCVQFFQRNFGSKKEQAKKWRTRLSSQLESNGDFRRGFDRYFSDVDPTNLKLPDWSKDKPLATRNAFGDLLELWANEVPNLIGGSADLEGSNMTGQFAAVVGDFQKDSPKGRNLSFGVREFPMSALCNGLALHGGFIPFDATFLSFADYSRAALRLGAIQRVRVIHEFSHDSFYLGEDGPTHQAVEHVMSLRLIPNFFVMRPADANETALMLKEAIKLKETPSALCLSRQKLPHLNLGESVANAASRGAYVVREGTQAEFLIFASGSEVSLALEVADQLGDNATVVSVPCWELFDRQDDSYRKEVLNWAVKKRISIEAGVTHGWERFTGLEGLNIGLNHFGDSAPAGDLAKEYGFTPNAVIERIKTHWS